MQLEELNRTIAGNFNENLTPETFSVRVTGCSHFRGYKFTRFLKKSFGTVVGVRRRIKPLIPLHENQNFWSKILFR